MTIETNFGLEDSQEMKSVTEPVKLEENDLETQKDIEIKTVIDETKKELGYDKLKNKEIKNNISESSNNEGIEVQLPTRMIEGTHYSINEGVFTLLVDKKQLQNVNLISGMTVLRGINDISALHGLTKLTEINFMKNQITDISALKDMDNLTKIDLHANKITDISALKGLNNLKHLRLSYNAISDISALEGMESLEDLDLGGNDIIDFGVLETLTNLKTLSLGKQGTSDENINNYKFQILSITKQIKNLEMIFVSSAMEKEQGIINLIKDVNPNLKIIFRD